VARPVSASACCRLRITSPLEVIARYNSFAYFENLRDYSRMAVSASKERRPEPHFSQPLDRWEDAIVANAPAFVLARRRGVGAYERIELQTFPEMDAKLAQLEDADRWLRYAISAEGRSVCMERGKWDHYRALWARWNSGREG
jgi:hypothetical protein